MEERKYYHYTFTTYHGKYALIGDIANHLRSWFYDIAKEKHFEIIALNILGDHVHILVEQMLNDSPAYIMKCIKGASSYKLFELYPNTNRLIYRKLWSRSYNCREISENDLHIIVNYIKNQTDKSGIDKRFNHKDNMEPRRLVAGS